MDTQTPPLWEDLVIRTPEKASAPVPVPVAPAPLPEAPKATSKTQDQVQAAYLTHELRAPITAIRLGLEIFSEQVESKLEADEKQMLSLAVRNTARLENLVNDIMDHTKIMAGKMGLDKEPCDGRQLIGEAIDSLQAMAISKGVKLHRESDGPLPRISAEPGRVVQVLTNLISNAIKYTPARGSVTVSVKEGKFEHAGTLVFRVRDTGRGIQAEEIEKIFDMFIQSKNNVKKSDGTGLGLTLARAMVSLHGGRIWAESWKGVGASFYFTIPIESSDLREKIEVYPKPIEYHGLLVSMTRRFNAFLALFI